jgi:predicted permease
VLNAFIINISLPALALLHIHDLPFDRSLVVAALMPWIVFAAGALFFRLVGGWLGLPPRTIGCLTLLGGLGNTSFVGLPMIEAFYGREALGIGILADQPGSFLTLATAGLVVATRYSSGDVTLRAISGRVLRFPPFIAMLLAVALIPVDYPDIASSFLRRIGDTLAPLALVSVGLQLRLSHLKGNGRNLALGLAYKMVLAPALILLILSAIPGVEGLVLQVTVFEAAMAPMITAGIVAIEHDLDPPLATLMLGIGIPLSFLTLPFWAWVTR